jgi:hypothetical protein
MPEVGWVMIELVLSSVPPRFTTPPVSLLIVPLVRFEVEYVPAKLTVPEFVA